MCFCFFSNSSLSQNLNEYKAEHYVVAGAPFKRIPGKLKTKKSNLLLVKTTDGKELQFFPEQILSFRAEGRNFIVVDRFKIGTETASRGFAEVIDSGQVLLLRYIFTSDEPVWDSSKVGNMVVANSNSSKSFYLIRQANSNDPPTALVDDWFYGPRKIFNRTLAPFVPVQRPDLVAMVAQNKVSLRTIVAFIHALNTGQPFK